MARSPFVIDVRLLPEGGKELKGTLPVSFFDLAPEDMVQASGPLSYDLHAERDGDDLVVTGRLEAPFNLLCGRCAEPFPYLQALPDYYLVVEPDGESSTLDLTDTVREDILLALPSYPRCEDGNVNKRECSAQGRFDGDSAHEEPQRSEGSDPAVWDVLDQLQKD